LRPILAEAMTVSRFKLANGLRVWVQPRDRASSVTALLVVRAGARNETPVNNGVSHFVEHMVFTGTERWNEDEIKDAISHRGGKWNGWTSLDRTTYFVQVADREVDAALDWLSQIVVHPTFPADKIDKERAVIFQERFGRYGWLVNTLDSLGFGYELDRDVRRAIFPRSTLGLRVVGEDGSLEQIDRTALRGHYEAYYTPDNAALILVGNLTAEQARVKAETYFGAWARRAIPSLPETPTLPTAGPQRVTVRGPTLTEQETLLVGARTVGAPEPDRWALTVLADILEEDLTKEIRYRQGLVYALSAFNYWFDDAGYFGVETSAHAGNTEKILAAVERHLEQLRQGQVSAERLKQAQTTLKGQWSLSMEDNLERAGWLADWAFLVADDAPVPDYIASIGVVTAADLARVVDTYFTPQRRYIGLHQPIITVTGGARLAGIVAAMGGGLWIGRKALRRRKV
jgi:predicted Zn-dependent peptidase